MAEHRDEALAAGADGYVVKPYKADELVDTVYAAAAASMSQRH